MKIILKDFQQDSVEKLVKVLRRASRDVKESNQAVLLSAPTGAGKTIIITACIERVIEGDDEQPPNRNACFLWISDQPQLNEQSRRKVIESSNILNPDNLITIDSTFDQRNLKSGNVYFLNIQRIGKDKKLVSHGDKRSFTIWETINNTIIEKPSDFYVIIDEAHRGMLQTQVEEESRNTIIQKIIKGSPGQTLSAPIIIGITATPERFIAFIHQTGRDVKPREIRPEDVRESGLLKDKIRLYHPSKSVDSDFTLLRAATETYQEYCKAWANYCKSENEEHVKPMLVVQVEDAARSSISNTDIATAIEIIKSVLGPIPDHAFAHAFQEQRNLQFGSTKVRYTFPSEISSQPDLRIVFFKTSLNTGWDCPRAEVMMSFRKASDVTSITQLVGRLVRTPLARRINKDPFLNSVSLFLPHYDSKSLKTVLEKLTSNDEFQALVEVDDGLKIENLRRAAKSGEVFKHLENLPSCIIPRGRKLSGIKRLMKLARLIANDEIRRLAIDDAKSQIFKTLDEAISKFQTEPSYREIMKANSSIKVSAIEWLFGGEAKNIDAVEILLTESNIDGYFDSVGRRLGEGIHKSWLKAKSSSSSDLSLLKRQLIAVSVTTNILNQLETVTQTQVQNWLSAYSKNIQSLPESCREGYEEVWGLAPKTEERVLIYPDSIEVGKSDSYWDKHLFVNEKNKYPAKLTSWEELVIQKEIDSEDVIFWLRNIPRQKWSLTIDYEYGGNILPFFPDFLVVRKIKGKFFVDILDPHLDDLADAPAKANGLARFASRNLKHFGRIELIRVTRNKQIERLNLCDEKVRIATLRVNTSDELKKVFERFRT